MSTISGGPQRLGRPPRERAEPQDEAATVEVAALAALIARPEAHAEPAAEDDDDAFLAAADLDLADDDAERAVPLLPRQRDEFVCSCCFLVAHVSQLADPSSGRCRDCA